jgi:hypothetical protein
VFRQNGRHPFGEQRFHDKQRSTDDGHIDLDGRTYHCVGARLCVYVQPLEPSRNLKAELTGHLARMDSLMYKSKAEDTDDAYTALTSAPVPCT